MLSHDSATDRIRANHQLIYTSPGDDWLEALPLGNGRLGAMCLGGDAEDVIWLNDSTMWSGPPRPEDPHPVSADAAQMALAESRAAVAAGHYGDAASALQRLQHSYAQSYQPLASLRRTAALKDRSAAPFERGLNLAEATAWTRRGSGTSLMKQQSFVSHADQVMVMEIDFDDSTALAFALEADLATVDVGTTTDGAWAVLQSPDDVAPRWDRSGAEPVRYGVPPRGVHAAVGIKILHAGVTASTADGVRLLVEPARRCTVLVAVETTYTGVGKPPSGRPGEALETIHRRLEAAAALGEDALRRRHIAGHQALYERTELTLGDSTQRLDDTTARVAAVQRGETANAASDPGLLALLFHYGRYLLISSSREGGPPANLQGIWNRDSQPPWSSNYTLNINLEMNYWLAETTDLSECLPPLFELITALARHGEPAAKRLYGAPGWTAHHCSDIWGYVEPIGDGTHDVAWAFWPMAGTWLVTHLWDRLAFSADPEAIREHWPVLAGAARFVLHWLQPRGDGTLGTSPSTSPENIFIAPGTGEHAAVAADSTMDLALARNLMRIVAETGDRLGIDDPIVSQARAAFDRIPQPPIGSDGLVSEWADLEEMVDPHHRHMAHLVFLHPLDGPVPAEVYAAASRSLDGRKDDSTGWSLAWKIAMRARLGEPAAVQRLLDLFVRSIEPHTDRRKHLWRGGLYPNLFSAHPPFQIDGNLGFVAALAECFLQSHTGVLELLPAVPEAAATGEVRGLRARGDIKVDLNWRAGRLISVRLTPGPAAPQNCVVRAQGKEITVQLSPDHPVSLTESDFGTAEEGRDA